MSALEGSGPAQSRSVVVVGASAGGVGALKDLIAALPGDLPASLLVVLHLSPDTPSVLPQILNRAGPLTAVPAADGEALAPGHVYVGKPDRHLLLRDGVMRLDGGPRENGHRPSIDVLFRSAAAARGRGVIGVVLSGTRDDGTLGLATIKQAGGAVLVQDPDEAEFDGMPRSAIAAVRPEVHRIAGLAARITELAGEALPAGGSMPLDDPPDPPDPPDDDLPEDEPNGRGTRFTCPECGGVLGEVEEAGLPKLRCSVGHAYGLASLVDENGRHVEHGMWLAARSLQDRAALLLRYARHLNGRGEKALAERALTQAHECMDRSRAIERAIQTIGMTALYEGAEG